MTTVIPIFRFWNILLALILICGPKSFGLPVTRNIDTVYQKKLLDSSAINPNSKILILLDKDGFLILTTYQLYVNELNIYLQEYKDEDAVKLLDALKRSQENLIRIDIISGTLAQPYIPEYLTYNLLCAGKCLIFNKAANALEKIMSIHMFDSYNNGIGKTFHIGSKEVFRFIEGVY